jgi:hypothetical protein
MKQFHWPVVVSAVLFLSLGASIIGGFNMTLAAEPSSIYVRKSTSADTVIVFVHGILGDGLSTWTNQKAYWPALLTEDHTFDGSDVFVYSYPTGLSATFSIDELAEDMRSIISGGNFVNYDITWDDAERVFVELSKEPSVGCGQKVMFN